LKLTEVTRMVNTDRWSCVTSRRKLTQISCEAKEPGNFQKYIKHWHSILIFNLLLQNNHWMPFYSTYISFSVYFVLDST
jgi:hypothetical protein